MLNVNHSLQAHHYGGSPNGPKRTVRGIILHDTAGSGTHNDTVYLSNPSDGRVVSVDFTVERDGSIYQLSPSIDHCWCFHAGRHTSFKGLKDAEVNKATVGIEIVQRAALDYKPTYPYEQVKAVALLCYELCTSHNLTKDDISTHARIITDHSRTDPRQFPFDEFYQCFNDAAQGDPVTAETSLGVPTIHLVVAGDTLYSLSVQYQTPVEKIKALNGLNTASNLINVGQSLIVKE